MEVKLMSSYYSDSRRRFLKSSVFGGLVLAEGLRSAGAVHAQNSKGAPVGSPSPAAGVVTPSPARVALTTGNSRSDNTFRALRTFEKEITQAIGNKLVIVKPNDVSVSKPLCATHADQLEGILEFLKSIRKTNVVIAESPADGSAPEAFDNYGYNKFAGKYGVKLVDLDKTEVETVYCVDQSDLRPHACRVSRMMVDPDSFIISAAKLKTHFFTVATFSLKNVVVAAAIKEPGAKPGGDMDRSNRFLVHGGGVRGIHYNLVALAPRLHPHLAVIDGFEGMEGEGPVDGTPVDHRVCVVSTDWLAADTVSAELMGLGIGKVGHLTYAAQAGLGQADLNKIEILGPALKDHIKIYKEPADMERLLSWQKPLQNA
jgi:uncharacterized protein (DUF362 family)